jgi:hypothetical protein
MAFFKMIQTCTEEDSVFITNVVYLNGRKSFQDSQRGKSADNILEDSDFEEASRGATPSVSEIRLDEQKRSIDPSREPMLFKRKNKSPSKRISAKHTSVNEVELTASIDDDSDEKKTDKPQHLDYLHI